MKSAFEKSKGSICEEINKTKTFTQLKEKLIWLLAEYDFSEE